MIRADVADRMIGADAVDPRNECIGRVHHVLRDSGSDVPTWVSVQLVRDGEVLVPLDGADWDDHELHVSVTEALIREAPETPTAAAPSGTQQDLLCGYYGLGVSYAVHDDDHECAGVAYEAVELDPAEDAARTR